MSPSDNVEIITFGCRLNAFESDVIRRLAGEAGLRDTIIVNTCAVTAEAERQARQAIRRARREQPEARIIVTGCAATLDPSRYAALAEVDLVLDNEAKLRLESYALESRAPTLPRQRRGSLPPPLAGEGLRARRSNRPPPPQAGEGWGGGATGVDARPRPARARAYLQVQQGCDHRCTFCIIPYARGPSRSVPLGALVAEARALIAAGYREIVLTGVDLTAYGADLPGQPSLGQMVRRLLAAVPELPRLRLSSLDPSEIDDELWRRRSRHRLGGRDLRRLRRNGIGIRGGFVRHVLPPEPHAAGTPTRLFSLAAVKRIRATNPVSSVSSKRTLA